MLSNLILVKASNSFHGYSSSSSPNQGLLQLGDFMGEGILEAPFLFLAHLLPNSIAPVSDPSGVGVSGREGKVRGIEMFLLNWYYCEIPLHSLGSTDS